MPEILFSDAFLVVVNKPPGLPSVPGRAPGLEDCAVARVQRQFADVLTVHRLDMPTSGLLLFARGATTQRALSRAFEARQIAKEYVAVVDRIPQQAHGLIDLPLMTDWPNRPRQKVDRLAGKPAQTYWQFDCRVDPPSQHGCPTLAARREHESMPAARLLLRPVTGRSHQLRVHLAAIGHPILGDALYAPAAVQGRSSRLLLHATQLKFAHPETGQALHFRSSAPF